MSIQIRRPDGNGRQMLEQILKSDSNELDRETAQYALEHENGFVQNFRGYGGRQPIARIVMTPPEDQWRFFRAMEAQLKPTRRSQTKTLARVQS